MPGYSLTTTATTMAGGSTGSGTGMKRNLAFSGTVASGERLTVDIRNVKSGEHYQVGSGYVTGAAAVFTFTYNSKEYVLAGNTIYFSDFDAPTAFNDPAREGNGYVTMANHFGNAESLQAVASYQGRLAIFSRNTIQTWNVAPLDTDWALVQVLDNIGTMAKLSVQSIGDLDVMFLSDTGLRSLRSRESTLNAFIDDVGSPIDSIIQSALLGNALSVATPSGVASASGGALATGTYYYKVTALDSNGVESASSTQSTGVSVTGPTGSVVVSWSATSGAASYRVYRTTSSGVYTAAILVGEPTTNTVTDAGSATATSSIVGDTAAATKAAAACGATDPNTGQYWCYLNGMIYVRSYYPSAKVMAWAAFTPVDSEGNYFVPERFGVANGKVFCRAGNKLYLYGGSTGYQYDSTVAVGETPWMGLSTPGQRKQFKAMQAAFSGAWKVQASMDLASGTLETPIPSQTGSTFGAGRFAWNAQGTHLKIKFSTTGSTAAIFSQLLGFYDVLDEQ